MSEQDASEFEIRTLQSGGVVVLAIRGQADLHTVPELRAAFATVIESGAKRLVVDLSETTFIDSMTIGALLGAVKRQKAHQGRLVVACSVPHVRRVFELTSLDRVFDLRQSVEEAVAALSELDPQTEAAR